VVAGQVKAVAAVAEEDPGAARAPNGARLRRHRLAAGLTQEELADRAGLSARGVQDLERGARVTPQRQTVLLLTRALGLAPGDAAALAASVSRARRPDSGGSGSARPAPAAPDRVAPERGDSRGRRRASSAGSGRSPPCESAWATRASGS
jgi:transcriptional regulator with XRE-family HTH domain